MLQPSSTRRTLAALALLGTAAPLTACGSEHGDTGKNASTSGGSAEMPAGSAGVAQGGNGDTAADDAGGSGGSSGSRAGGAGGNAGISARAGSGGAAEAGQGGEAASSEGGAGSNIDCSGRFGDEQVLLPPVMDLILSSPTVPGDELELFFAQRGATDSVRHVMRATRKTRDADFGEPAVVPELESVCADGEERSLSITADGLRLYVGCSTGFGTVVPGPLHLARRSARDAAFVIDAETYGTVGPSIDVCPDELSVLTTSETSVQNPPRTYARSSREQAFGQGAPIPGLEAVALTAPSCAPDGLTLFGGVNPDLVVAARPADGEPFGAPSTVFQGDNLSVYGSPEVSADCRTLYFIHVDVMSIMSLYSIRVAKR